MNCIKTPSVVLKFLHVWRNFHFPNNCHTWKVEISPHDRYGDFKNVSTCGVISDFSTQQMWRKNVYNWWGFIAIYAVLLLNLLFTLFCREIYFATIYALSCGEKLSPKVHLWRKNDKYQVCSRWNPTTYKRTPDEILLIKGWHSPLQWGTIDERIVFSGRNVNTNTIWVQKFDKCIRMFLPNRISRPYYIMFKKNMEKSV